MHWRMPCRQQSRESTQSRAESKRAVKPRASRLAGSARGRASRIGERQSNDTCYLFGRTKQKTERGQDPRPKQDKKAVKRHRFSGKQRRGQAPALHVWSTDPKSGQFAKKRAYSFPAKNAPRVRARIARVHQPNSDSVFGGRGALQRIRTAKNRRRFLSLTSGKHLPNCRAGACLTVRPAFQSMIMINHHLHSMAVMRKVS